MDSKTQPNFMKKKPYRAPVLHKFGNIEQLTKSRGNTGMGDGGIVAMQKKTAL